MTMTRRAVSATAELLGDQYVAISRKRYKIVDTAIVTMVGE